MDGTSKDVGLFGPDSVAWRLHADPTMLVGGLRALLVQALEPRAMAAVDQHSDYRTDPWGRLRRTTEFVMTTTYGDTRSAEAAGELVRRIHTRIEGTDPVTGRAYRADDPDLLLWIHAVEVHSFVSAYRRYAGSLTAADADRYVDEMVRAAELVGLEADAVPRTMGDLRDYLRGVPDLQMTPAARAGARTIVVPPMPLAVRPLWGVPVTAAVAIFPRVAKRLYGLWWFPPATPALRASIFTLGRVLNVVLPEPPSVRAARARLAAA